MVATICLDSLWCFPSQLPIRKTYLLRSWHVYTKPRSQNFGWTFTSQRRCTHIKKGTNMPRFASYATMENSNDSFQEITEGEAPSSTGDVEVQEEGHHEHSETRIAPQESKSRVETIERGRDQLNEELAQVQAKQKEYANMIKHDKELAIQELEAAKSMFHQRLQEAVQDKFALESQLVLAKQDAVELAVQVEKLAGIAFQQATAHILEDARLRVSAAESSASEAAYSIEEQIRNATEGTISAIVETSTMAIEKALAAAEQASSHAKKAISTLSGGANITDEVAKVRASNIALENRIMDLESHLMIKKSEIEGLKTELGQAVALAEASSLRADTAEGAMTELQELTLKKSIEKEEEIKLMIEQIKKEAMEREKAAAKALKIELEGISAAIEAARETAQMKEQAYSRRCFALQRSLSASEAACEVWRQRAEMAESLLLRERSSESQDGLSYLVNGGRIDILTDDDSLKWKLLAEGPRREIPDWISRRIRTICPKFPPKKTNLVEALATDTLSLKLPKLDEVWSIAQEKLKETDELVDHVIEKEVIEKKRKALERALHRKTVKWQRTPETIKLEPGTGTGREIVFQGFNWESWRRRWYMEMATKASDLSQSGITAVWLPPPTESVAPQGYMPSDLYNLNSAYGTVDELKQCIDEMHAQDILVLGDAVLNHRCAQKQSPNGVWNIFGGQLAWGPEAIVCDDPNFQGCGNPSTGDIFHAAPNIDHSQEFVRKDVKEWLNWLRNEIGFDGWRLDFVRGFSGGYVKEYIEASNPAFAIGEYWDSLAYEGGNLCYNQDAHRQRIVNWINATGGTSSAFDVTSKGILHSALHNQYWRLIDPQGKPTGVMGWWPSRAVTFLENHDTGSTQGHWPFPRDKLAQGYAYILTHPGTPTIFYDHFYDFGLRDTIAELVEARTRAGVSCRSAVEIYHANNDGYVARVDDSLAVKIGHFDWNPSKENDLDGTWRKFVDRGPDYQLWLRQ